MRQRLLTAWPIVRLSALFGGLLDRFSVQQSAHVSAQSVAPEKMSFALRPGISVRGQRANDFRAGTVVRYLDEVALQDLVFSFRRTQFAFETYLLAFCGSNCTFKNIVRHCDTLLIPTSKSSVAERLFL